MEKIGVEMYDTKEKHNYIKLSSYDSDECGNIDSLDIRPTQVNKSNRSSSRSKKREYSEGHRDKHSRKHYDDESTRDDKYLDRRKHRSRHHYYNDRAHHKENKGDLLGSRHSDPCKYDVKHSKDYKRHSHRHSESHRRYKNDYYYSNKYNNNDNSNIKVGDEFESKHSKRYRCDINDDDDDDVVEEIVEIKKPRVEEIEEETEKGEFPVDEDLSDWESDQDTLNKNIDNGNNSSNSDEELIKSEGKDVDKEVKSEGSDIDKEEKFEHQNHDNVVDKEEDLENDSIVEFDENLPPYYPAIQGCRSVEEFQCLNRIEEGTYGVVYRFKDKRTNEIVALKRLKMEREKEGFPITSLREINTLLKSQHENIVTVREIVVGSNMDKIYIVMDYVEHDLKSLIELMRNKHQKFVPGEIKCLLKQLLSAVAHLHDNWILHRDLKTSNLLLSHQGILKVGDFGLAREYGSPLKPYTPIVVTLWYRAPELLLGTKQYSTPIDMWSVGCIFAELVLMHPLFTGKSEIEQLHKFFKLLGTPNDKIWPGFNKFPVVQKLKFPNHSMSNLRKRFRMLSDFGVNLLTSFLTYDPNQRITAEDALKHPYFLEFPQCIEPSQFPKWPAKSELGHKKPSSPKAPSGGGEFKKLGDEDGFRIGTEEQNHRFGGGFFLKF